MASLNLKIIVIPTYDITSMIVVDASAYPNTPPVVSNPFLVVESPGFNPVSVPFNVQSFNILTSDLLGITEAGLHQPLPDGIYRLNYSIDPPQTNHVQISIMRVDRLQEKWDNAFMSLDMMECDMAIKTQAKVDLNTIYLLIQGSIAAGNNCADIEAYKLYHKASNMLDSMMKKNCGCSGNNYMVNFP